EEASPGDCVRWRMHRRWMRYALALVSCVAIGSFAYAEDRPEQAEIPMLEESVAVDDMLERPSDEADALCSSDSDCAGYGRCRSGTCGYCSSDSDCSGHGGGRIGRCGGCGRVSDCGVGRCRNGACNACSSDSDCDGYGRCRNSQCGGCSSDSDCRIGRCRNSHCGA